MHEQQEIHSQEITNMSNAKKKLKVDHYSNRTKKILAECRQA